jgi:hypothetical protein
MPIAPQLSDIYLLTVSPKVGATGSLRRYLISYEAGHTRKATISQSEPTMDVLLWYTATKAAYLSVCALLAH